MSQIYLIELPSAFRTSIGKNCYCSPDEDEETIDEKAEKVFYSLSSATSPEVADYILEKLDLVGGKDYSSPSTPELPDTFWSSQIQCKLESTQGTPTVYKLDGEYDLIHNGYIEVTFPEVWLKEEFRETHRISICPYWGFALIEKVQVKSDKISIYTNDKYGIEALHSYMRDHAFTKELESDAGTDAESNSLQVHIRAKTRCIPLYLFYSLLSGCAFPVYRVKKFGHHLTFSLDIARILRIHEFRDGKWRFAPFDATKLCGLPSDLKLANPSFFAELNSVTPNEKRHIHEKSTEYCIDDMIAHQSSESKPLGSTIKIKLSTNGLLCRTIFFSALNVSGLVGNNHFNFTDKIDGSGETPIEYVSLVYGTESIKKVDRYHISHFKSAITSKHFRSAPVIEGQYALALDRAAWLPGSGSGIQPESINAEMIFELRQPREGDEQCLYDIKLRLKVSKTVKIDQKGFVSII